jgi:hypothetical protein
MVYHRRVEMVSLGEVLWDDGGGHERAFDGSQFGVAEDRSAREKIKGEV